MHQVRKPCCKAHYSGGGGNRDHLNIYRGPIYQQAGGGFFGDIFRQLVPLFSERIAPYVGKRLIETGDDVLQNMKSGVPLVEAVKRSAKRTYKKEKDKLFKKLQGSGCIGKRKRKRTTPDFFKP